MEWEPTLYVSPRTHTAYLAMFRRLTRPQSAATRHFSPDEGVTSKPCIHAGSGDVGRSWAGALRELQPAAGVYATLGARGAR